MANLFLSDATGNQIRAYDQFTSTLVGTINTLTAPEGVAIYTSPLGYGEHMLSMANGTVAMHAAGWSSTIIQTLPLVIFSRDVDVDPSGNVQYATAVFNLLRRQSGFTTSVLAQVIESSAPAFCGTVPSTGNTYLCVDGGPSRTFKHNSGFTATNLASFTTGASFVTGGISFANGDLGSVQWVLVFGTQILAYRHDQFTSTILTSFITGRTNIRGMAYYEGTFDFSIRFRGTLNKVFGAAGAADYSAEIAGLAAQVFVASGAISAFTEISGIAAKVFTTSGVLLVTADVCHWISGAELAGWLSPASGGWQAAGAAEWYDAVAPGDWAQDADGDWFDPKECG